MSKKLEMVKELFALAKELIYPPPAGEGETPEEKKIRAATGAIKDIAEVALKLQSAEGANETVSKLAGVIDKEIGKLKALVALSLLISASAVILAVLLK